MDDTTTPPDDRLAASRRALLLALHPDGTRFADWMRARAAAVDWDWTLRAAQAHKVAPLLAARAIACGVAATLDAGLQRRLDAARADAAARAAVAQHTLATLTAAFAAAEVPFFVVKGSVLVQRIYGDPQLRRFADIDVVVREADVARAEAALRDLGYYADGIGEILAQPPRDAGERATALALTRTFGRRHLAAFTWYAPRGGTLLVVDLHWHVAPARLRVAEAALWQRLETVSVGDTPLRTFDPPATLLHLAAHATTCLLSGFRLLHLCDLAWAARQWSAALPATWELAAEWRADAHLARVCTLVRRLLDVDIPVPARWRDAAALPRALSAPFLLDAPDMRTRPWHARLGPELTWALAMRSLRRNVGVTAGVAAARARFRLRRAPTGVG